MEKAIKPRLMLHCCCAPCLITAIERLINYEPVVFFFNPNIQPYEEYKKRLESVLKYCNIKKLKLVEGDYDVDSWFRKIRKINNYEKEPEGGKRCSACFELRLEKTADLALSEGIKFFSTTLTLGENKNSQLINSIGKRLGDERGLYFVELNLKKKKGKILSLKESREHSIYRQNYCGCIYSMKNKI
jgi:predicted adenine nucleotide alpha hydrolase (AANH) superfamily ATPase